MLDQPASDDQPPTAAVVPRRVLIRGVNWLGDAVMATSALERLREALPEAHLTLLTHEKLADLWRDYPCLDAIITFASGESAWSVGGRLRAGQFDAAVVLPNSPRSALEIWLARIPQRIGYARPWRNWFLTQAIPTRPGHVQMRKRSVSEINRLIESRPSLADHATRDTRLSSAHQIHEYLHLAATMGANPVALPPRLHVVPDEVQAVAHRFSLDAVAATARPLFGLNPGAEYGAAKRWPPDRFVAAARQIQQRTNCAWLLLGGPSDLSAANAIYSALAQRPPASSLDACPSPLFNLAGKTTLRELMALLKLCRVLLTNDTGPMHLAAALGTPVVVPFGSTSPLLTGPGLPGETKHRLLASEAPCRPCFRRTCPIDFRCMTGIGVERVVEAVLEAAATA